MAKSVKGNAALNTIRILITTIFPLITFPYATRVLGVDNMGKVQFGLSVVSYCSLLAALGVSSYGVREGAACRDDRKKFSKIASEIFSINVFSTILSYFILALVLLIPGELRDNRELIFLQSIVVLFNTMGVDWIYGAQEDYLYITIRSFVVHIVAMVLMFLFVKHPDDYYKYALTTVIATAGASVFNFLHAKKYCDLKLTKSVNLKKHLKPLLILFSSALAVQIYVNSDVIMLGMMTGDASVGYYSVAAKIYSIIKSLLNALIVVSIPRLSYYSASGELKEYFALGKRVIRSCLVLVVPALLGLFLLSSEAVSIIAGSEYGNAVSPLRILSFALVFAVGSNFFGNAVLVVQHRESEFLAATIIGALVNIGLNFVLIPTMGETGAALTTLIAESTVMAICMVRGRNYYKLNGTVKNLLQIMVGCIGIVIAWYGIKSMGLGEFISAGLTIVVGLLLYFGLMLLVRNEATLELSQSLWARIRGKG